MKRCVHAPLAVMVVLVTASFAEAQLIITRSTFAPSATSTGGGFTLRGTAGQADADPMSAVGSDLELTGGFWPGTSTGLPTCNPDLNGDGVIGMPDLAILLECVAGNLANPQCDFTHDNVVNADDHDLFIFLFGESIGPSGTTTCSLPSP